MRPTCSVSIDISTGCAFSRNNDGTGQLCGSAAYGVNDFEGANSAVGRAVLFAHELGHNAAANHVPNNNSREYIMEPNVNSGTHGFASSSKNAIRTELNRLSSTCIGTISGSPSPSPPSARQFYIINPRTTRALDVSGARCDDGTNIHLWRQNGTPAQIFRFGDNGSIINVRCNKALDLRWGRCDDSTNLQLWRINGTGAQSFRVEADGMIRNTKCNKVLDVNARGGGADASNIQLWSKDGGWNQEWEIRYLC